MEHTNPKTMQIIHCTICGQLSAQFDKKVQSPFVDNFYTLYKCTVCLSYFFDLNEHDFNLEEFYNDDNMSFDARFSHSKYWARQVKRITKLTHKKKKLTILDIGCRTGDFLLHWGKGNDLYGVELNKNNALIAKERGLTIYNDFVENIDFDTKFDVITCYAILEHIANPSRLLAKLTTLFKENGVLVIMIPTIESGLRKNLDKKGIYWHMYSPPGHLSFYSKKFLDDYFSSKGLRLISRYYTAGGLNGRYSKNSAFYPLLKKGDYESLNSYYFKIKQKPSHPTPLLKKIANKLKYYKRFLLEEYLPINKYPYYDHMYSYYKHK